MLEAIKQKLLALSQIDLKMVFLRVMANPGIQQQLVDFNKAQLNDEGVFADGTPTGDYSPKTIAYKIRMGQPYDHVTLRDTGATQDSMNVKIQEDGAVINADTWKPGGDLGNRYPEMLGLTPESIDAIRPLFNEIFLMEYKKEITRIING